MQLFSKWHMWSLCFHLHYKTYALATQLFYVKLTLYKKELFSKRGDVPTFLLYVATTANLLAECSFEIGK